MGAEGWGEGATARSSPESFSSWSVIQNVMSCLQMYLTGGSHYTCEWNFGDGSANYITNDTDTSAHGRSRPKGGRAYTTIVSYTYNTTGHYNVSVNCSNSVSMENVIIGVKVQERISGLRLTKTSQDKDTPVIICWRVKFFVWSYGALSSPEQDEPERTQYRDTIQYIGYNTIQRTQYNTEDTIQYRGYHTIHRIQNNTEDTIQYRGYNTIQRIQYNTEQEC